MVKKKRELDVFYSSVFFVLGFSLVFSVLGVLLQSVLSNVSSFVQLWLSRIAGLLIIIFGFYMMDLISLPSLPIKRSGLSGIKKLKSPLLSSFVLGSAFAVGWTPCVGSVLGAILALAVSSPYLAFPLMLSYSLGLGLPFILVGYFTNEASHFISRFSKYMKPLNNFFGGVLALIGVLVFTNQLSRIASFALVSNLLLSLDVSPIGFASSLNIGIAFAAGVISFLSPCILPLIPAYLTYLAGVSTKKIGGGEK